MEDFKDADYIPYSERSEWKDVIPVQQKEADHPIAPINYSFEYKDAMDYFRAISINEEVSERALELTETIINFSPAHYTVWLYRQKIIQSLSMDLNQELEFLKRLVEENPKCYQLWQHRQFILSNLNDASSEEDFINLVLEDDNKNFHAWSYRQWVIKKFNLFSNELSYTNDMLTKDVRNNSAWNQRYFVLTNNQEKQLDKEVMEREIEFTVQKMEKVPFNEAAYNYLKGLLMYFYNEKYAIELLNVAKVLEDKKIKSKHLYSWYVDIYYELIKLNDDKKEEFISNGIEYCNKLLSLDIVRKNYWEYRLTQFEALKL
ncbi:protein prenylyltransferase [Neoconidiobolus thromboides FSU 785]|nr:protein prenylyltransferase [Neoconidiobolus thromboides FSU 785]